MDGSKVNEKKRLKKYENSSFGDGNADRCNMTVSVVTARLSFMFSICVLEETGRQGGKGRGT
jgi:hypothetical protein